MHILFKLAILVIPINLIAVAIVQLQLLNRVSREVIENHFGNNTLIIIAHPDDETMFFGPLIVNLVDANKYLDILCLSNGDSGDLGLVRERELTNVVNKLGSRVQLKIVNDIRLLDGLDSQWETEAVIDHIDTYVSSKSNRPAIVSFDSYGVSGHPNHRSIAKAIEAFQAKYKDLKSKTYSLKSVNIFRKYISFFDTIITHPPRLFPTYSSSRSTTTKRYLTVALNFFQSKKLRQLLALHESQMIWFRQLYSIFSRYMFINDFTLTQVSDLTEG